MKKRISGLAHCCHHNVHWEYCYDYEERVRYIRKYKPASEVKLRLKLFQIIPDDKLPGRESPAWEAYAKAFAPQLAKLHSEMFPDCPWDGKSIFPELEG